MGLTVEGETYKGVEAWTHHYASWAAAQGLGSKVNAFVAGAANILNAIGIPAQIGVTIMGVFVASFAGTTLDSATRIQRYLITEMFPNVFRNRYVATAAVLLMATGLVFSTGADGKGALALWPVFGAINQVLAALTLIIISVYLKKEGGFKWLLSGIPALFMIVMSTWASVLNQISFLGRDMFLTLVNATILLSIIWVSIEGLIKIIAVQND